MTAHEKQRIKEQFDKAKSLYPSLQSTSVQLVFKPIKSSTMQAQPIIKIGSFINGIQQYKINIAKHVRDSNHLEVSKLPDEVLRGWFAHELGHIVDYTQYSVWGMLGYGLKYVFSVKFRRKKEYIADHIAMQHGFKKEILAVKKFLFFNEMIDEKYRQKMKDYYMSIEEVENWVQDKAPIDPID